MEIEMQNLTKQYGNKCAVNGVNCRLKAGVNALLGANGAGKTTLRGEAYGI